MADEKERFGEKMKLVERAKEDIYFAEKDRELLEKIKARLRKVDQPQTGPARLSCPKCSEKLETYTFMEIILDRCSSCGGLWFDQGELEALLQKVTRGPLASLLDRFLHHESGPPQSDTSA